MENGLIIYCDNKMYSGRLRGDSFMLAQDFCKPINYNSIHKITKIDIVRLKVGFLWISLKERG